MQRRDAHVNLLGSTTVVTALRRAYFAQAGDVASRYGVAFDRVIRHLWQARRLYHRISTRSIVHVDDLVHAVACIDGDPLAWSDLWERYERSMRRSCLVRLTETDSLLLVRRLIRSMESGRSGGIVGLQGYVGTQPLREWLAMRVAVELRSADRRTQLA